MTGDSCVIFRFVIYLGCFVQHEPSCQARTLECSNLLINQWQSSRSWAVSRIPLRYAVNSDLQENRLEDDNRT